MSEDQRAEHGRERLKRENRRRLRAATLDLGHERGWDEITIRAIAARAGVSPRTFFNYFATKEDAALLDLFAITDDHLAALALPSPLPVWTRLAVLFAEDAARAVAGEDDMPRYLFLHSRTPVLQAHQLAHFAAFQGRLAGAIERAPLGARDADDRALRAAMMAGSCITAARVGLERWRADGRRTAVDAVVGAAFAVLAPAFLAAIDESTQDGAHDGDERSGADRRGADAP